MELRKILPNSFLCLSWNQRRNFEKIWGTLRKSEKVWGNLRKSEEVWGTLRSSEELWGALRKSEVIWGTLRKSEEIWGSLRNTEKLWGSLRTLGELWRIKGTKRMSRKFWGISGDWIWQKCEWWDYFPHFTKRLRCQIRWTIRLICLLFIFRKTLRKEFFLP